MSSTSDIFSFFFAKVLYYIQLQSDPHRYKNKRIQKEHRITVQHTKEMSIYLKQVLVFSINAPTLI